jgi:hypothetical protein
MSKTIQAIEADYSERAGAPLRDLFTVKNAMVSAAETPRELRGAVGGGVGS